MSKLDGDPTARDVRELIRSCMERDPKAWREIWDGLNPLVTKAIRRFACRKQLDPDLADEMRQEYFLFLREQPEAHLHGFRGSDWEQFHAFMRAGVWHFAQNYSSRDRRRSRRTECSVREASRYLCSEARGDEVEIRVILAELLESMNKAERRKIGRALQDLILSDESRSTPDLSRREKAKLQRIVRRYFDCPD